MKVTLMAFGSRGDIQPFVALATALQARGHQVMVAAPSDFDALFAAHGIPATTIPLNSRAILEKYAASQRNWGRIGFIRFLIREVLPEMRRVFYMAAGALHDAAQGADLIIAHGFLVPYAYSIHQHLGIPLILGIAAPLVKTSAYPSPMFPPVRFGKAWIYPRSYGLLTRMVTFSMMGPMRAYRERVGLPALRPRAAREVLNEAQVPVLMHHSRHLMPPAPDWNANARVVGQWQLPAPEGWTPPESLEAFLAQGEPPVYIGFGSMPVANPAKMSQTIGEALRRAGLRGVLQAGWAGLAHEDEHLITIGDVPHDWLFPRVAAAVHHGGSGTTHSVLSAGKPALIVPFNADQPMWARRLVELGVGVPPIRPGRLTPENLAEALRTLTQDQPMRQRAEELGALLREEDGLTTTCDFAEQYAK